MFNIWIIFGAFALLSWIVSSQLRSRFNKYSQIPVNYGFTGKNVAEKMLADNGIYDVQVKSVSGKCRQRHL